jgi:hypothetical protein
MSKEKNKNTFRVAALLLVACLISSVMLSGTFAKYTSEYAGEDTALVARWSFGAKGGQSGSLAALTDSTANLDLFQHAYDTNILSTAGTDKIIAPGVSGDFVLDLTNNSDVAAGITFTITEDTSVADIPMEFSLDNFSTVIKADEDHTAVENLTTALDNLGIILAASDDESNSTTIKVHWRWPFERGTEAAEIDAYDTLDTDLGEASYAAYTPPGDRIGYILTVKVKATQLAPTVTP